MAAESDHIDDFTTRIRVSRMLRQARGSESLESFARRLDVPPDHLDHWESGDDPPCSVVAKALRLRGVPITMFDLEQLLAAAELTESTKRFYNSPTLLLRRAQQLLSGHGRLIGWAVGMSCGLLIGTYTLSNADRIGSMIPRAPVTAQAAPTVQPSGGVAQMVPPAPVPVPPPTPAPPAPQETPASQPETPAPDPTPVAVVAPSPSPPSTDGGENVPAAAPTPPAPAPTPTPLVSGLPTLVGGVLSPGQ